MREEKLKATQADTKRKKKKDINNKEREEEEAEEMDWCKQWEKREHKQKTWKESYKTHTPNTEIILNKKI